MQNNDIEKRIISQFTKIGFVNLTNIQKQSFTNREVYSVNTLTK